MANCVGQPSLPDGEHVNSTSKGVEAGSDRTAASCGGRMDVAHDQRQKLQAIKEEDLADMTTGFTSEGTIVAVRYAVWPS